MDTLDVDLTILGGGVLGLSIAEACSREMPGASIVVLEQHQKFGQEISSHNSEVIHAGLYYQGTEKKRRWCIEGRELLYQFCKTHQVPHLKCGKYIVATAAAQLPQLESLLSAARANQVPLEEANVTEVRRELSNPSILAALWSPETGVVDSHQLMQTLEARASERGVHFLYGNRFRRLLNQGPTGFELEIQPNRAEAFSIRTRAFVNAAGMASAKIARQFFEHSYEIRPCRGRYFSMSAKWSGKFKHLVYPLPDPAGGLGVHLTFDLAGKCRLGPDVDWSRSQSDPTDPSHYRFDDETSELAQRFLEAGRRLFPELEPEDLAPDYVGVRPKLFEGGIAKPEFVVQKSSGASPDWHLLGIESPGLTGALAAAKELSFEIKAALAF